MVFIGQAGGDNYGVKGRMYALDAASGKRLWETWLVPREEQRAAPTTPTAKVAAPTWSNAPKIPIGGSHLDVVHARPRRWPAVHPRR